MGEFDDLFDDSPKVKLPTNQLMLSSGKIITFNDEQNRGLDKIRT